MLPPLSPQGFVTRRPMGPDVFWPEQIYVNPRQPPETRFDSSPVFGVPHNDDSLDALCDDVIRCVVRHLERIRYPLIDPLRDEIFGYELSGVRPALDGNRLRVEMAVGDPGFVTEELLDLLQEEVFWQGRWGRHVLHMTAISRADSLRVDRQGASLGRVENFEDLDDRLDAWRQASYDALDEEFGSLPLLFRVTMDALQAHPSLVAERQARVLGLFDDEYDDYPPTAWVYVPVGGEFGNFFDTTSDKIREEASFVQIGPSGAMGFYHLDDDPRAVGKLMRVSFPEGYSSLTGFEIKSRDTGNTFWVDLDPSFAVSMAALREHYGRIWPRSTP